MFTSRHVKWILIITLSVMIFTYSRRYSRKERYPLQYKLTNCERGGKCSTQSMKTTQPTITKPTKRKTKKPTTVSYLENVHILPNDKNRELQEIVMLSNKDKPLKRKLLIISYFDWGGPSIGDILNQHPDVFYFNEPLQPFDSTTLKDGEEPISRRYVAEAIDYLGDLFDCKILDSSMGYSDKTIKKMAKRAYKYCSASITNVSECIQSSCKSSQIVISKTIRLYIQDVRDILSKNKGLLKIIILQRDPRVNLNLRIKKVKPGWIAGSDMFFQGRSLCSRMLHDVQEAKRLEGSGFKDFYRVILFEHFLKTPEKVLKGIFTFLGVTSDEEDIRRILKISSGYKQIKRVLLNKWDWLPEEDAGLHIDKACSFFYKNSLYNPMKQKNGYLQRYNLCKYCD